MKTTAKNLRELNSMIHKHGDTNTIYYAGYYMLTMDGKVRAYYWENKNGTRLGMDFTIDFSSDKEDFIEENDV